MDLNKILIVGLIICSAAVIIASIPHYFFGAEMAMAGTIVRLISYLLGVLFVGYVILAVTKGLWKAYKGMTLLVWILGILSVGFLLLTGMLVGWYAVTGGYLPTAIAQSAIPLRTISIYFGIAGILMLLSLLMSKKSMA